jgi:hypothetical protein
MMMMMMMKKVVYRSGPSHIDIFLKVGASNACLLVRNASHITIFEIKVTF